MTSSNPGGVPIDYRTNAVSNPKQYDILLNLNRFFQTEHGFEVLTPDAKLFCVLGAKGSLSVKEAMLYSGLSYRGFYLVAGRLAARGSILLEGDPHDGRVRRISLAANARSMLAAIQETMPMLEVRQEPRPQIRAS
jgi:DNA-binding MarR family transcriptional regulator